MDTTTIAVGVTKQIDNVRLSVICFPDTRTHDTERGGGRRVLNPKLFFLNIIEFTTILTTILNVDR